ncbi:hypothetical protein RF11_13626 [Thelohanellus kitauei]|uniref:Uncharacterized protein n=1 Tax=Thelohanellus kitauei TaxID=669202 RepID=A0A0C2IB72_THEKT|nr:hypothetical protein RF11_13626 [Thelohanellus kitauei]
MSTFDTFCYYQAILGQFQSAVVQAECIWEINIALYYDVEGLIKARNHGDKSAIAEKVEAVRRSRKWLIRSLISAYDKMRRGKIGNIFTQIPSLIKTELGKTIRNTDVHRAVNGCVVIAHQRIPLLYRNGYDLTDEARALK